MPPKQRSKMSLAMRGREKRMQDNPNTDRASLDTMREMISEGYGTDDVREYAEAVDDLNDAAEKEVKGAELAARLAEEQLREQNAGDQLRLQRAVAPLDRRTPTASTFFALANFLQRN